MNSILASRTISSFPLSIGTSLAMETVFNPKLPPYDADRKIPDKVDISQYTELWVNITTLIRNILGSVPKDHQQGLLDDDIAQVVSEELDTIDSLLKEEGKGTCILFPYFNTYEKVINNKLTHKAVQFRIPTTPAQLHYANILSKVCLGLEKNSPRKIYHFKDDIKSPTNLPKVLILTHQPWDLLSYHHTRMMDLIESHTGTLKTRQQWNTKYYSVEHDAMLLLPFTKKLLLIFGDHVLIKPMAIAFRKMILDIAQKRNFTPLTSEEKVRFFLDLDIKERYLMEVYSRL